MGWPTSDSGSDRCEYVSPTTKRRIRGLKSALMTEFAPSSATRDGLYDSTNEHDACGVAMVARLDNEPRHEVVSQGLLALENLEHRGAAGADASTGDGAGILIQLPDL